MNHFNVLTDKLEESLRVLHGGVLGFTEGPRPP